MSDFSVKQSARKLKAASRTLGHQSSAKKDSALQNTADQLRDDVDKILSRNKTDLENARQNDRTEAFIDRLKLTESRIEGMASDIEEIIQLPDPVGGEDESWLRPNGLRVARRRIPLGVIGMIYEARPNVTTDATALCLKSGNGIFLKGGSDAFNSNQAIYQSISKGLEQSDLPDEVTNAVGFVDTTDRAAVGEMLELSEYIDVIIPRGGEGLIRFVDKKSEIPVIRHEKGVCHLVIDGSAPTDRVDRIALNAKTQRTSVCNAVETILFLESAHSVHLQRVLKKLSQQDVYMHLDSSSLKAAQSLDISEQQYREADDSSYHEEFLDLEVAIRVVEDLPEAIEHIEKYGSSHTEAIVTEDYDQSETFKQMINSSVVLTNASTRFSDGNQLGLGAEIGISTTRLQAYGPMGLEALTTTKFVVSGRGQIRE